MCEDVGEMCGFGWLVVMVWGNRVGKLIEGRRAVFLGDSGARNAYGGFVVVMSDVWSDVSLMMKDGEKYCDWVYDLVGGVKVMFMWVSYVLDVVDALDAYGERDALDLIVIFMVLWYVLYDELVFRYKMMMVVFGVCVCMIEVVYLKVVIVWIDVAFVIRDKFVVEDKRVKFIDMNLVWYVKI